MRLFNVFVMFLATPDQSFAGSVSGVYELYQTAQTFLGTLNSILDEGIDDTSKLDKQYSERLDSFKYDWLSVIGYNKGLMPLVSDFFFNYHGNQDFMRKNGKLVSRLNKLLGSFQRKSDVHELYKHLHSIVAVSVDEELFQDGVIRTFMLELKEIVDDREKCILVLGRAISKRDSIVELLNFLIVGVPKSPEPMSNGSNGNEL